MGNNLKTLRTAKGLSQEALARAMGTTRTQLVKLERGERRLSDIWIVRAAAALKVDPGDLMSNRLQLASFDPDEHQPDGFFEPEAPEPLDPDAPPRIPSNGIVEVDARAGMGGGGQVAHAYYRDGDKIETRDAVKPDAWVFPPWFLRGIGAKPGELLIIEAKGDSMRPTIAPGTPLIIDTRHRIPSPDGIYAIRDRWGDIQAKRIETSKILGDNTIRVISDNGGHVQIARSEDELQIVGKVVAGWHFF
ncbi:LexA family transcriptional regulator [Labrys sp. LIt4]|uniref:XRE family transcriptional regulator n=1 Tax=Labrys sp. LIt4 TaxID=2821355 RepID=UPI001AE032DA|nr:LexA family transcriptional regulator [Labrys sp. LIt4]MBP0581857.1 LexA family transcriptional regulator [Labrys sp. LIt4]